VSSGELRWFLSYVGRIMPAPGDEPQYNFKVPFSHSRDVTIRAAHRVPATPIETAPVPHRISPNARYHRRFKPARCRKLCSEVATAIQMAITGYTWPKLAFRMKTPFKARRRFRVLLPLIMTCRRYFCNATLSRSTSGHQAQDRPIWSSLRPEKSALRSGEKDERT